MGRIRLYARGQQVFLFLDQRLLSFHGASTRAETGILQMAVSFGIRLDQIRGPGITKRICENRPPRISGKWRLPRVRCSSGIRCRVWQSGGRSVLRVGVLFQI